MGKIFNTTGVCRPDRHYMVNIDKRLNEIEELIAQGAYFTINRARQFGKTTTIRLLRERLSDRYIVLSISFEGIEKEVYAGAVSVGGSAGFYTTECQRSAAQRGFLKN